MEIILGGRQTGRTTKLIKMCAEAEARRECSYLVTSSQREAYRVSEEARKMGIEGFPFPISYDEFFGRHYSEGNIKNFFIDNADYLLGRLTPVRIAAISIQYDNNATSRT